MKTTITTLAFLAIAASAAAHNTPIPHTHHAADSHWLPIIAFSAVIAIAIAGLFALRTNHKTKRSK